MLKLHSSLLSMVQICQPRTLAGWAVPLHLALHNGYVEVTQFLVEHGASCAAQKKVGGLRGIWHRIKDMWKSRNPLSSSESRASSSELTATQML